VIISEGDENDFLYRVKSGTFRVEKNRDGRRTMLATMTAPAVFGEMSFLDGSKTTASIIADEDGAQLYKLEIALVKRLFVSDPALFRVFYQFLATISAKRLKGIVSDSNQQEQ
jgi:CRP-like cAMP-binding protein